MVLMNLFSGRIQWSSSGDTDIENRLVDTVVVGESGSNGESSIDICTLSCVK